MSTKQRKTRNPVCFVGVSDAAFEYFAFGSFFDGEEWAAERTEGEIEAFWKEHRTAILQRFSEKNRRKGPGWEGSRPEYFWKEIQEPRLVTGQREYYNTYPDREKHVADVLETDHQFLKRLGLLAEWELKIIQP